VERREHRLYHENLPLRNRAFPNRIPQPETRMDRHGLWPRDDDARAFLIPHLRHLWLKTMPQIAQIKACLRNICVSRIRHCEERRGNPGVPGEGRE
jgi:hypothetical protein